MIDNQGDDTLGDREDTDTRDQPIHGDLTSAWMEWFHDLTPAGRLTILSTLGSLIGIVAAVTIGMSGIGVRRDGIDFGIVLLMMFGVAVGGLGAIVAFFSATTCLFRGPDPDRVTAWFAFVVLGFVAVFFWAILTR